MPDLVMLNYCRVIKFIALISKRQWERWDKTSFIIITVINLFVVRECLISWRIRAKFNE